MCSGVHWIKSKSGHCVQSEGYFYQKQRHVLADIKFVKLTITLKKSLTTQKGFLILGKLNKFDKVPYTHTTAVFDTNNDYLNAKISKI